MEIYFKSFVILLLSGCAIIPEMEDPRAPRTDLVEIGQYNNFAYPTQDWWKVYQDQQLNEIIEEGLLHAPNIAEATARVLKAHAIAKQAGASLLPTIAVDASVSKYRQSYNNGAPVNLAPQSYQNLGKMAVNFDYEIDFWSKNSDSLAAAISEVQAAKLQLEQAKVILSTSIATAYANLARLYASLDIAKEIISVRTQTTQLFLKRYKDGLENESSVEQAKSTQSMAEADLAGIEENINLTCNSIVALIGAKPYRALQIKRPQLSRINYLGIPLDIPSDLIGRRPDVIASKLSLESAASQINVAKAGFYPNINLVGYTGYQSLGINKLFSNNSIIGSYGPSIHLPIFSGGLLEGQYIDARADYNAKLAIYESSIIQALQEAFDAITSKKALEIRIKKTREALDCAERAYKIANNRYSGGLSNYLEVLRSEDNLILNRRAMADINARAFTLDIALIKAVGGGFKLIKDKE